MYLLVVRDTALLTDRDFPLSVNNTVFPNNAVKHFVHKGLLSLGSIVDGWGWRS